MLIFYAITATTFIAILGGLAVVWRRMQDLETRFDVVEAESRSQFERLSDNLEQHVRSHMVSHPADAILSSQTPLTPRQTVSSVNAQAWLATAGLLGGGLLFALPMLLSFSTVSAIWAVASLGLSLLGLHYGKPSLRGLGLGLLIGAIICYLRMPSLGVGLVIAFALLSLLLMHHRYDARLSSWEIHMTPCLACGLLLWSGYLLYTQGGFDLSDTSHFTALLLGAAAFTLVARVIHYYRPYDILLYSVYGLFLILGGALLFAAKFNLPPNEAPRILAWAIALGTGFYALSWLEKVQSDNYDFLHAIGYLLLMIVATWASMTALPVLAPQWDHETGRAIARVACPALGLLLLLTIGRRIIWPCQRHFRGYYWLAGGGIAVYLGLWTFMAHWYMPGEASALSWPLLHPLDITTFSILVLLAGWILTVQHPIKSGPFLAGWCCWGLSSLGFAYAAILRYQHHVQGADYHWKTLVQSPLLIAMTLAVTVGVLAITVRLYYRSQDAG